MPKRNPDPIYGDAKRWAERMASRWGDVDFIAQPERFAFALEMAYIAGAKDAVMRENVRAEESENRGDDVHSVTSRAEESVMDKGVFRYDADKARLGAPSVLIPPEDFR